MGIYGPETILNPGTISKHSFALKEFLKARKTTLPAFVERVVAVVR